MSSMPLGQRSSMTLGQRLSMAMYVDHPTSTSLTVLTNLLPNMLMTYLDQSVEKAGVAFVMEGNKRNW